MAIAWYLTLAIAVVTLVPFEFHWPESFRLKGFASIADLVENVALFVPFGFFVAFSRRGRPAVAGFALSLLVEFLQQFLPGRYPSLLDLGTNTLGALLGGIAHRTLASSLGERGKAVGVAALDLPLMGLVYLAVPLLWLSGLTADDPYRRALVALLGLSMAVVLASVSRHYLESRGVARWKTATAGAIAMFLGMAPGWLERPVVPLLGALGVAVIVSGLGEVLTWREPLGRRFEAPTVRRALLPLICYLIAMALWPFPELHGSWAWTIGLGEATRAAGNVGILQLLELMGVATIVGYALAERRGRLEERPRVSLSLALRESLMLGFAVAALRGFHPGFGAGLADALLLSAASFVGSILYVRQRAYIQALLGRPRSEAPIATAQGRVEGVPVPAGPPTWR